MASAGAENGPPNAFAHHAATTTAGSKPSTIRQAEPNRVGPPLQCPTTGTATISACKQLALRKPTRAPKCIQDCDGQAVSWL
eukprot:9279829-Pyramimonas_sp.AAC.1